MILDQFNVAGKVERVIEDVAASTTLGRNGIGVSIILGDRKPPSPTTRTFKLEMTADEARSLAASINRECDQFSYPSGVGVK